MTHTHIVSLDRAQHGEAALWQLAFLESREGIRRRDRRIGICRAAAVRRAQVRARPFGRDPPRSDFDDADDAEDNGTGGDRRRNRH